MFKKMPVCRLMISCPSDVKTEVEIINRVVDNINDSIGISMDIFVKTLYWSKNVMPEAGNYPQSIINKQILDKSDAIIAIFGNRIGSPTQHYESGTIEEIELMIQKGKQVFVYFSDKPVRKSEIDMETSVYKGYKQDKIEMRGDRAEMSDFPLYLNTVAGGLDCRDQTIGGFSFVVKIYALPVVEIIG